MLAIFPLCSWLFEIPLRNGKSHVVSRGPWYWNRDYPIDIDGGGTDSRLVHVRWLDKDTGDWKYRDVTETRVHRVAPRPIPPAGIPQHAGPGSVLPPGYHPPGGVLLPASSFLGRE